MKKPCKISASTMARTAALALALTNQLLSCTGHSVLPIESEQLEQLVSTGITVAAALVNWWENNSFTPEAIEADQYLTRGAAACTVKRAYFISKTTSSAATWFACAASRASAAFAKLPVVTDIAASTSMARAQPSSRMVIPFTLPFIISKLLFLRPPGGHHSARVSTHFPGCEPPLLARSDPRHEKSPE